MAYRRLINTTFQRYFLVIFFLALAGMFGIIWWIQHNPAPITVEAAEYYQPAPTPGGDLEAIQNDAEIKIPSSARNIHAYISGAQAIDTWVRLDLPAADLPQFLANAHCTGPLALEKAVPKVTPAEKTAANPPIDAWWQLSKATRLEKCTGGHDYLHQTIYVDKARSDVFTIYIYSATDDFRPRSTPSSQP